MQDLLPGSELLQKVSVPLRGRDFESKTNGVKGSDEFKRLFPSPCGEEILKVLSMTLAKNNPIESFRPLAGKRF